MSDTTNISWCDATWNPWRGCSKVSPGCKNCYAETLVNRFGVSVEDQQRADERGADSCAAPCSAFDEIAVDAALRRIRATQNVEDPTGRYKYPDCADVLAAEVERLRSVCEKQQWRIASLQQDMRTIMTVTRWEHQAHQIAKRALTPNESSSPTAADGSGGAERKA